MSKIGYDFNGVVDIGLYIPTPEDVIITGISVDGGLAVPTLRWLKDAGIECVVFFNPYPNSANNFVSAANWKAEMINKLELVKFYEDMQFQYDIIKPLVPNCNLIKV